MKITKDIEMEVMVVHNLFWESYAHRDIELRFSLCSEDVTFIGSGLHERALNKTEYKNINKEGVKQFPDPFQIEFLWTNLSMLNEVVACVESEVVWSQMINNEISTELLRNTTLLKYDNSKWLVTHVHGSVPDYRLKEGDYMTNEQTIIRNRELERQVFERTQDLNKTLEELEKKNRELEIEGSLEKVRTIAMGMRKPDDMLDVCKTISLQLQSLGVKEIRNVQTAIIYASKSIYINYEYYAKYKKQLITEVDFKSHYYQKLFVNKMLKGTGEIFTKTLRGKKVKEWYDHQKTTNQFADRYLGKAKSLSYYWFSLGPLALGISTYFPLSEEQLNLFKRFRNVFELAYQRYLDIEKAETQAKEAQIEASLERVRAVAMGMNKSDDLLSICEVSFNEFKKLGIDNIRNALIHIQYDNQKYFMDYDFSDLTGGAITKIEYGSHPVVEDYLKQIRSAKDAFYQGVIEEDQLEEWKDFRRNSGQINDPRLDKATALYYYFFSIGIGDIGISTLKSIDESQIKILKRFRNVFDLAYRRYNDITLAEEQAREAQIELALERVRARTMAMQRSEELQETSFVLFEQMRSLGETAEQLSIGIFNENRGVIELSITLAGSQLPKTYEVPFDEPFLMGKAYQAWKAKKKSFVYELSGKALNDYNQYRNRVLGGKLTSKEKKYTKRIVYFSFFSKGLVGFSSHEERPSETILLIERFAGVFDLTYTRFNDLKKAEAQAREAQIEAALERVRSRTMGMHKSEELREVIRVVYEQLIHLKINVDHAGFVVDYKPKGDWHFWIADEQDIPSKITHPYFDSVWANQFNEAKEKSADFFATNLNFEDKNKFYNELLSYVPGLPKASKDFYLSCPGLGASTVLLENVSLYIENFSGTPYTDEENNTLMRFGKVFQQTYTRFLDLQKAEAQAREAQIEAALERVRSKAMAMHSSEDLAITVDTFFLELNNLKVTPHRCGMGIIDEQSKIVAIHATTVTHNNEIKKIRGNLKLAGHPVLDCIFNNWKLQKEYHPVLRGNEIIDYYKVMNPQVSFPDFAGDEIQYGYYFFFIEGGVFAWTDKELADGDLQIFRRYTSVLSLTYRRYKDLKEAEAQAREAEIELSLERVRSKAMAMHSPNDLSETVNVFFKELKTLDIIPIRCGVGQIDEATRTTSLTTTTSSQQGDSFHVIGKVKQTGHPVLDGIFDHWKIMKDYHPVLEGEDIKAYYNVMNAQIGYPEYPKGITQYGNNFFFKEGFVFAWTENLLSEEELIIFRRFTSVLSLTYRRYMDLTEAEAQAKEAQIEAALERVRSRTMGMQKSDELAETVSVLFKQLLDLGIQSTQLRTCGIVTFKENEPKGEIWITDITGEIIRDSFIAPFDEAPAYKTIYSKWKKDEKFLELNLKGTALIEHLNFVKRYSDVPNINLDEIQKMYSEIFFHVLFFSQGYLFIISYEPLPEYHDIFKRFGALFQQTYTRFLDFKKVEAQNKIIQAENERKTKELEDARQLQLSMLPKEIPNLPHLDIAVYMKTATEVGGDYYDFHVEPDGTLTILVGDATGHGMRSGMMVSIMKSFFISNRTNIELEQFFENSNNSIKDMHLGRLMMPLMGVQITSKKVIATNAGMPSLLYFRNKSQKAGEFVSNNMPLGAMKGIKYSLKEINYEKGDALLLMSDGFAELKNENGEQYGYRRVKEEFMFVAQKSPNEIVEYLKNSASQWANEVEPDDDVTFVIIKIRQ